MCDPKLAHILVTHWATLTKPFNLTLSSPGKWLVAPLKRRKKCIDLWTENLNGVWNCTFKKNSRKFAQLSAGRQTKAAIYSHQTPCGRPTVRTPDVILAGFWRREWSYGDKYSDSTNVTKPMEDTKNMCWKNILLIESGLWNFLQLFKSLLYWLYLNLEFQLFARQFYRAMVSDNDMK